MNNPSRIIAACAMAALLGSTTFAHDKSTSSQSSGSAQQSSGGQQNTALQQAQAEEFFRASKLVGKSAQTPQGQKIGDIKDIVFNQKGQIFALVDAGNKRWAVVPWQAVNAASAKGDQNLVLNLSEQQLKTAPAVSQDQWGSLNNPQFVQGVYSYYHVESPTAIGGAESPSGMGQGQGSSSMEQPSGQQQQQSGQGQQPGQSQQEGSQR